MSKTVFKTPFIEKLFKIIPAGPEKIQAFAMFALIEGFMSREEDYELEDFMHDMNKTLYEENFMLNAPLDIVKGATALVMKEVHG